MAEICGQRQTPSLLWTLPKYLTLEQKKWCFARSAIAWRKFDRGHKCRFQKELGWLGWTNDGESKTRFFGRIIFKNFQDFRKVFFPSQFWKEEKAHFSQSFYDSINYPFTTLYNFISEPSDKKLAFGFGRLTLFGSRKRLRVSILKIMIRFLPINLNLVFLAPKVTPVMSIEIRVFLWRFKNWQLRRRRQSPFSI